MSVNPTFQNNANPNGGRSVPKGYQGSPLDPNVLTATVLKRRSARPIQMWKVVVSNGRGDRYLMWTERERLADDLAEALNKRDFQSAFDVMDWTMRHVPLVTYGKAGTSLKDSFHLLKRILEHEISNAKGRAVSAKMFAPQYDADPLEEAVDAILDNEADTFGIGQPNRKSTAEWEPDVPDPAVDLMKSIRDACTR